MTAVEIEMLLMDKTCVEQRAFPWPVMLRQVPDCTQHIRAAVC